MKELILDPFLRWMGLRGIVPCLKDFPDCNFLDVGCGWEAKLLNSIKPHLASGTGIDFKTPDISDDKLKAFAVKLDQLLPLL